MNSQAVLTTENNVEILYLAFELSRKKWKLGFSDGKASQVRQVTISAGDLQACREEIEKAKRRFGMKGSVRIRSCYEAGREGFWLHRALSERGIENTVVDASSIEVNRRQRRAKTDRMDVEKLVRQLVRYWRGERDVWRFVRVPEREAEDRRQLHRELETLKEERKQHRIEDEYHRLQLVEAQIRELQKMQAERVKRADQDQVIDKVRKLQQLIGIGIGSSWIFVMELFGWRQFQNRREVAAAVGLTPTPYNSGDSIREQGISRAGSRRVRQLLTEIAWCWLRLQPNSKLSRWYKERFAGGGGRMRRIGIVAVARRLLIALWRYVEFGEVPEGAQLKAAAA
jgi:transposase